jgi:hypothetical protein
MVLPKILLPQFYRKNLVFPCRDFQIGYSLERVNPGDKDHVIEKITKVVSGMDNDTTDFLVRIGSKIDTPVSAILWMSAICSSRSSDERWYFSARFDLTRGCAFAAIATSVTLKYAFALPWYAWNFFPDFANGFSLCPDPHHARWAPRRTARDRARQRTIRKQDGRGEHGKKQMFHRLVDSAVRSYTIHQCSGLTASSRNSR